MCIRDRYNIEHNITPTQIKKAAREAISFQHSTTYDSYGAETEVNIAADPVVKYMDSKALGKALKKTRKQMEAAATKLDFVEAARLRDEMYAYEKLLKTMP